MDKIGLKINGIWCVLDNDVSINIQEETPVFSDSGSFSYPIEMNVADNRELFGVIDSVDGYIRTSDLDNLPFELYYDGILILSGITEMDEDVDVEDTISVNLVSGNGDFKSKIEGVNAQDVPLLNKIFLGYSYPQIKFNYKGTEYTIEADEDALMEYINVNVSDPYPLKSYCNARICVKSPSDQPENPYIEYEADRPWSGVCFYVSYFLECLFEYLGYTVSENNISYIEDLNRLAFFNTRCEYEYGAQTIVNNIPKNKSYLAGIQVIGLKGLSGVSPKYVRKEIYATNQNFPSITVSSLIDSLFSAFGIKIMSDTKTQSIKIYYIKDILNDNEVINVHTSVLKQKMQYSKIDAVSFSYGGSKDDTAYNYSDYSNIKVIDDYLELIKNISGFDQTCYIDRITGNKYRIKVNSEAIESGDVNMLNPSLFEVGQFNSYTLGDKQSDNKEELTIDFNPIISNDVNYYNEIKTSIREQRMAIYVDVDMKDPERKKVTLYPRSKIDIVDILKGILLLAYDKYINYDMSGQTQSPLRTFDSGFTVGVMRGAGNNSKLEFFINNYDENGNDAWTTVVADYAYTEDTMDAYGNRYDYNGTNPGGVDDKGRISLKLHIENREGWGIDATAAKRGLADRFMSEYIYFLLNRKVISMDVQMNLSEMISLNWMKRVSIGGTIGFIKSKSYTLTNTGVTNQKIELYVIN